MKITIAKKYKENGDYELKAKKDPYFKGKSWVVVFENGVELDTGCQAYGKDGYKKKDLKIEFRKIIK